MTVFGLGRYDLTTCKFRPRGQGNGILTVVYDWLMAPNIANNIVAAHYGVGHGVGDIARAPGLVAVNRVIMDRLAPVAYREGRPVDHGLADPCPTGFCASLMQPTLPQHCNGRYCPPRPPRCGAASGNILVPPRERGFWSVEPQLNIPVGNIWENAGFFMSCDEYPLASTTANNGVLANVRISCVPDREQKYQGSLMNNFYKCLRAHLRNSGIQGIMPFYIAVDNMPEDVHERIRGGNVPHFIMGPEFNGIGYTSVNGLQEFQSNTDWTTPRHPGC
jgi:hypothetical protein